MGEYTSRLAQRIKRNTLGQGGGQLLTAEYVSASAIRIGGEVFSHGVHVNPDLLISYECGKKAVAAGDSVLVANLGTAFYVICKI